MKTIKWTLLGAFTLVSFFASAAYEQSWYLSEYWNGEYPNGFSVVAKNVSLPARAAMDPSLPISISCAVPFKAVYHPWNRARSAKYLTLTKIVPMVANEDLVLGLEGEEQAQVSAGEVIEFLNAGSEGIFLVRFKGVEYNATVELLDKVTYKDADIQRDEWLNLTCGGGENAWILMSDVYQIHADGEWTYAEGLDTWFRGFRQYNKVTDLSDQDLKKKLPLFQ